MKTVKLSYSADMKIRLKLYFAGIKKNIHSLSAIKLAVPALMLGVFIFGVTQLIGVGEISQPKALTSESNVLGELRGIKAQTYKTKALARVNIGKAQNYKSRAQIRSIRARQK